MQRIEVFLPAEMSPHIVDFKHVKAVNRKCHWFGITHSPGCYGDELLQNTKGL